MLTVSYVAMHLRFKTDLKREEIDIQINILLNTTQCLFQLAWEKQQNCSAVQLIFVSYTYDWL